MIKVSGVEKYYELQSGRRHYVFRDLNFEIPSGKNIGLIGKNGAGKSTLISLLSGSDTPTRGEICVEGQVSPPLGMQMGLLPKLSGRENAKFICRLKGDNEANLKERLRYISEFAELGSFFAEPVSSYSSGMRARLALAISMAYHYDYFLIDELTAVGDEAFKRRLDSTLKILRGTSCFVIVSHSMQTLKDWCDVGLYLKNGEAHYFGTIDAAISFYMQDLK